jgi:hypothetical protein
LAIVRWGWSLADQHPGRYHGKRAIFGWLLPFGGNAPIAWRRVSTKSYELGGIYCLHCITTSTKSKNKKARFEVLAHAVDVLRGGGGRRNETCCKEAYSSLLRTVILGRISRTRRRRIRSFALLSDAVGVMTPSWRWLTVLTGWQEGLKVLQQLAVLRRLMKKSTGVVSCTVSLLKLLAVFVCWPLWYEELEQLALSTPITQTSSLRT